MVKIVLDSGAFMPERAHDSDAGLDLFAPYCAEIPARGRVSIKTGVHIAIPCGYVGMIKSKSGLMRNFGIRSEGTVDSGYTGQIEAVLFNDSDYPFSVRRGDKITQLVILPCKTAALELVETLEETERGDGGFGSTGRGQSSNV